MKRWLVRILIVLALLIFVVPMLIPLPPVGVEASVLAEPDGRFVEVNGLSTMCARQGIPMRRLFCCCMAGAVQRSRGASRFSRLLRRVTV